MLGGTTKFRNNAQNFGVIVKCILNDATICFMSRKATLKGDVVVGKNTKILDYVKIEAPVLVKGKQIRIGENTLINNCTCLLGEIYIGNNVLIGPNVSIIALDHDYSSEIIKNKRYIFGKILIEDNVWIGANSVILKGIHIGKGSIIGAGSVVTHDVPENLIVVGNPAKVIRKRIG